MIWPFNLKKNTPERKPRLWRHWKSPLPPVCLSHINTTFFLNFTKGRVFFYSNTSSKRDHLNSHCFKNKRVSGWNAFIWSLNGSSESCDNDRSQSEVRLLNSFGFGFASGLSSGDGLTSSSCPIVPATRADLYSRGCLCPTPLEGVDCSVSWQHVLNFSRLMIAEDFDRRSGAGSWKRKLNGARLK